MNWEPWSGCQPYSAGCQNCYFYGQHASLAKELNINIGQEFY